MEYLLQFNIHSDWKRDIVLTTLLTVGPVLLFHFPFSDIAPIIWILMQYRFLLHLTHCIRYQNRCTEVYMLCIRITPPGKSRNLIPGTEKGIFITWIRRIHNRCCLETFKATPFTLSRLGRFLELLHLLFLPWSLRRFFQLLMWRYYFFVNGFSWMP